MINDIILRRKSIKQFQPLEIDDEIIEILFKAASFAPSSYNEQPWSFIIARRNDKENFSTLLSLMYDKNRLWAKDASLIILAMAKKNFTISNKPNKYYFYDVSGAVANLTFQALSMGLSVHQIGGFDADIAKIALKIPSEYDPVVMMVLGYGAKNLNECNTEVKIRKPVSQFVFEKEFGNSLIINNQIFTN